MFSKLLTRSFLRSTLFAHAKSETRGCLQRRHLGNQNRRTQPGFKMAGFAEGGYIILIIPAVTFYLGTWQMKRKKWKEEMIEHLTNVMTMDPLPLPENLEALKDMELVPITVTGEFDYRHETYLGPKSHTAKEMHSAARRSGVHVITPFRLADRDITIMINRGWLDSSDWENAEKRKAAQVHGPRTVVGVVRLDQDEHPFAKLFFDSRNLSDKKGLKYFTHRHLDLMAKVCRAQPVYLDALDEQMEPGAPLGSRPVRDLRNDHLQYALTWYGVALFTFMFWANKFSRPLKPVDVRRTLAKQEAVRKNRKK